METPQNLYYSKDHAWIDMNNNIATIGITWFAQNELGEIVFIDLPHTGTSFNQDEVYGSVEAIKTVSDLFMPLSGKIIEINTDAIKESSLVNSDPFKKGWLIKIELQNSAEIKNLLNAKQYAELTSN